MASTGTFQKFIVIQSRDEHEDLSKLSPFVIDKFLKAKIGTLTDLRRLRGGQLLVKTDSETYSRKLLGLSDLAGVPVKATPHCGKLTGINIQAINSILLSLTSDMTL